ncbi:hypothetical protein P7C70_g4555, partial [Phenoliferia sp. Uapishka_3]
MPFARRRASTDAGLEVARAAKRAKHSRRASISAGNKTSAATKAPSQREDLITPPSDSPDTSSIDIPLRRRRHKQRPHENLATTEPYKLWQRALDLEEPLPSWTWSITEPGNVDLPWLPRQESTTSVPPPEPVDGEQLEPVTVVRRKRKRRDFGLEPTRWSSRTNTKSYAAEQMTVLTISGSPPHHHRCEDDSDPPLVPNLPKTKPSPLISSEECCSTDNLPEEEISNTLVRERRCDEGDAEDVARSLISLSNSRGSGSSEETPLDEGDSGFFDHPDPDDSPSKPSSRSTTPAISSPPLEPPRKASGSEFAGTHYTKELSSSPLRAPSLKPAAESAGPSCPAFTAEETPVEVRSEALAFRPRKKPTTSTVAAKPALSLSSAWTRKDQHEQVSVPSSEWAPIRVNMASQRRTVHRLQNLLFRGGEDPIDPIYSTRSIASNLALLRTHNKIHHLPSIPNYAFLGLLRRKPRRDLLDQPFLYVKPALSSSSSHLVDSGVGQAANYVYGRRLAIEELRWLQARDNGLWTYITVLASVKRVNELVKRIKETERGLEATPVAGRGYGNWERRSPGKGKWRNPGRRPPRTYPWTFSIDPALTGIVASIVHVFSYFVRKGGIDVALTFATFAVNSRKRLTADLLSDDDGSAPSMNKSGSQGVKRRQGSLHPRFGTATRSTPTLASDAASPRPVYVNMEWGSFEEKT